MWLIYDKGRFNKLVWRLVLTAVTLLLYTQFTYAQHIEDNIEIYFRQDVFNIEEDVKDNRSSLERLSTLFDKITADSLANVTRIEINSWTSPEPGERYNQILSIKRSEAIKAYILERWDIPDSLLVATGRGVAWDKLRDIVESSDMQYRDEVLDIIDNVPVETWGRVNPSDRWLTLVDSRQKHLMDLRGGRAYWYLYDNIFPQLRYGSQISTIYKTVQPLAKDEKIEVSLPLPTIEISNALPIEIIREPLFAVKTNLLYDCLLMPQIELEVPIGDRWSAAGEWIFPWWVTKDNGYALQILSGQIEGRYWLGDRTNREKLTGWFGGVHAGGGLYDLRWDGNGYQGEFYIAAGLSAGYAHSINKKETLRLEYSLGVGYLQTDYRYYEGKQDNYYLVWQYDGKYTWLGPTKAKVSLVWMLYRNKKRGGVR